MSFKTCTVNHCKGLAMFALDITKPKGFSTPHSTPSSDGTSATATATGPAASPAPGATGDQGPPPPMAPEHISSSSRSSRGRADRPEGTHCPRHRTPDMIQAVTEYHSCRHGTSPPPTPPRIARGSSAGSRVPASRSGGPEGMSGWGSWRVTCMHADRPVYSQGMCQECFDWQEERRLAARDAEGRARRGAMRLARAVNGPGSDPSSEGHEYSPNPNPNPNPSVGAAKDIDSGVDCHNGENGGGGRVDAMEVEQEEEGGENAKDL
ncbi:unnamed protein product, partial [Discosporangium mesarthrocarpum]